MVATKHTDLLVFYQGGGYDGCRWEWNFFSFDKDGDFYNLYTSGCMGIKDEETALKMLEDPKGWTEDTSNSVYIYDITKDKDIEEFQEEHAIPSVVNVINHINNSEYGEYSNPLWFKCDCCEEKVYGDGKMEDYHGCGGIAVTADTKLCDECYSLRCCDYCGEYDEDAQSQFGYCSYHFNEVLEKMSQDNFKFIEFDATENKFYMLSPYDIDMDEVKDMLQEGDYWLIVTAEKEHFTYQKYIVIASSEEEALNDVCSGYLDGNYYEVIETVQFDYRHAIEYIENNDLHL